MFKEFSSMSGKGLALALVTGTAVIVADALLARVIPMPVQIGFIAALFAARLAEAGLSHNCPWSKVVLEGIALSGIGVLLLAADMAVAALL